MIAVEPNQEMRTVLSARTSSVEVLDGTAERIPLADGSADAVFVGDAFHWFDGAAAVSELARVLRPHGGVALLWNHWWSDGDDRMTTTLDPPLPAAAQKLFDHVYFSSGGRRPVRDGERGRRASAGRAGGAEAGRAGAAGAVVPARDHDGARLDAPCLIWSSRSAAAASA